MKKGLLFLLFILFSAKAVAQYMPGLMADRVPPEPRLEGVKIDSSAVALPPSQDLAIFFTLGILGLSGLVLLMATSLLWRIQTAPQIFRIFSIIAMVGAVRGTTVVAGF